MQLETHSQCMRHMLQGRGKDPSVGDVLLVVHVARQRLALGVLPRRHLAQTSHTPLPVRYASCPWVAAVIQGYTASIEGVSIARHAPP